MLGSFIASHKTTESSVSFLVIFTDRIAKEMKFVILVSLICSYTTKFWNSDSIRQPKADA